MSDPNAKPAKIRVSLTCEERILLVSLLTGARTRDTEVTRRRERIAKTLEILVPNPRLGRHTFAPASGSEVAALKFEVVEVPNPKTGEVVARHPRLSVPSDRPREWRLMPLDHAHIVDFIDNMPEGIEVVGSYQWVGLLDAFDIGALADVDDELAAPEETCAPDGAPPYDAPPLTGN